MHPDIHFPVVLASLVRNLTILQRLIVAFSLKGFQGETKATELSIKNCGWAYVNGRTNNQPASCVHNYSYRRIPMGTVNVIKHAAVK